MNANAATVTPANEDLKKLIREVADFPKQGINFYDITTLLKDKTGFRGVIDGMKEHYRDTQVDVVMGIEARGFIFAAALAARLGCGLVPVRKAGKLPPPTIGQEYVLEYGAATIEVPEGVLTGRRVFLVDDVLATGGTLAASADLIERAGGHLLGMAVLLELGFLNGRNRLPHPGVRALLTV